MAKVFPDTRSFILQTALQLFLQNGYKEVSYKDIIEKTGLSKGAIYHYFNSKEDLLVHVFEFLLEASTQPSQIRVDLEVNDYASFTQLYINIKKEQFRQLRKRMKTKTLQFNKILFFLEAINENGRLKSITRKLAQEETTFLEECFRVLEIRGKIPVGKDALLLAKSLYLMLQGTETLLFLEDSHDLETDFISSYQQTIEGFFKII